MDEVKKTKSVPLCRPCAEEKGLSVTSAVARKDEKATCSKCKKRRFVRHYTVEVKTRKRKAVAEVTA